MRPEVVTRAGICLGTEMKHNKTIFRNRDLAKSDWLSIAEATALNQLCYMAGTWAPLNSKDEQCWLHHNAKFVHT